MRTWPVFIGALAAQVLAGCSSAPNIFSADAGWFSKPLTGFATPDWGSPASARERMSSRPVGPEDLLGADGSCASASSPVLAAADNAPGTPPATTASSGGIALDMTECDVVRRVGAPEKFDVAANEGGERTLVLTYVRGARPGIYHFVAGRLVSIERAPDAPVPAKPQRPAKRRAA